MPWREQIVHDAFQRAWADLILKGDGTGPGDPLGLFSPSTPKSAVGISMAHFPPSYQFTMTPGHRAVAGPVAASGEISNDDVRAVPFGEGKR